MKTNGFRTSVVVATAFAATSCNASKPQSDARIQAAYDKTTGRLEKLAYDSNDDGKPDTWGYMDGARVIRVEADENQDGRIDRWEYHAQRAADASSAATPLDTIERIERSTRHDGKVSRREFFEKGALARVEEDTDADGRIDKWETYENGTLSSMALDTAGTGTPTRTFYYKPDGSLARIEPPPPSPPSSSPSVPVGAAVAAATDPKTPSRP